MILATKGFVVRMAHCIEVVLKMKIEDVLDNLALMETILVCLL